jgi:hypothetical protein
MMGELSYLNLVTLVLLRATNPSFTACGRLGLRRCWIRGIFVRSMLEGRRYEQSSDSYDRGPSAMAMQ